MTFLGTTTLALSLLAGAPESDPAQPQPQTRVEAPKTEEKPPTGRLLIGIAFHGARFRIEGDQEKKIPFRLSLPLGKFFQLEIFDFPAAPTPSDDFLDY
jgi:hypothetical protein